MLEVTEGVAAMTTTTVKHNTQSRHKLQATQNNSTSMGVQPTNRTTARA